MRILLLIIILTFTIINSYSQVAKVTLKSGNTYQVTVLAFTKDSVWTNIVPSIITNHSKKQVKKIVLESGQIIDKDNIVNIVSTDEELDNVQSIINRINKENTIEITKQRKEPPFVISDTLITQSGYKIKVGDFIKIGAGSTNDGDFKYIRINDYSLFRYYTRNGYNGLVNAANAFPRSETGFNYKIDEVSIRGDDTHGYVGYAKIKRRNTLLNYEIDIESAISSKEIILKENKQDIDKPNPVASSQKTSIADELIKAKKLLDEGIINKSEFEIIKKKILDN